MRSATLIEGKHGRLTVVSVDMDPPTLRELKRVMRQRRDHKRRATQAFAEFRQRPSVLNALLLMGAEKACQGSRKRARVLHERWQSAVAVMRGHL